VAYDRLYVEFMYYFNEERDYFECHEVMEELWLEEGRSPLYQGLLQVAVGLYHHFNGNMSGAVKLFTAAVEKLEPYPDDTGGIALGKLLRDSKAYLAKLLVIAQEPFDPYDLDIELTDPELIRLVDTLKEHPPVHEEP
jgi:predicted metal-dependent hydrolase